MAAVTRNLRIEQGATFRLSFTYYADAVDGNGDPILDANGNPTQGDPYDLTGCTAKMQIRRRYGDTPLVNLTEADGITLGGTTGTIDIVITDELTDSAFHDGAAGKAIASAKYDLELTWPSGATDRLLQGSVTISPNITRAV